MSAGLPIFGPLPYTAIQAGLQTERGIYVSPGSRVLYVRSTGVQTGDDQEIARRLLPTLASALSECRAGMGDTIFILPGHAENVTTTPTFVAGVRIVGVGDPLRDDSGTFTWSATTSQWAVTVKNVEFVNLRLLLDGANGVVKAIVTTAARTKFINCYFRLSSGASNIATIGLECGTGADNFLVLGCQADATTGVPTDGIKIVGTTVKSPTVQNCRMMGVMNSSNGFVHITSAATGVLIQGNILYNTTTGSTVCITTDAVAADGVICDNYLGVLNNGTASSQGVTFGAGATIKAFQNFCSDESVKSGLLAPVAAT